MSEDETNELIQLVERQFAQWLERERSRKDQLASTRVHPLPAVCLSRLYGCGGYQLAIKLQQYLEEVTDEKWIIFDRGVILKALADMDFKHTCLSDVVQFRPKRLQRIREDFLNFLFRPNWKLPEENAFELLSKYMRKLARGGQVIFVGMGASIITRDIPNCFHFRLVAGINHRIKSIMLQKGIDYDQARQLVLTKQADRDRLIQNALHCDIHDPSNYHALFNTEWWSVEDICHTMIYLMERRTKLARSHPVPTLVTRHSA